MKMGSENGRLEAEPGYSSLAVVLDQALARAQSGKGRERHAGGEPFTEQLIFEIDRRLGAYGRAHKYQAVKKIYESCRLDSEGEKAELLDAIVYLAARLITINATLATEEARKNEG